MPVEWVNYGNLSYEFLRISRNENQTSISANCRTMRRMKINFVKYSKYSREDRSCWIDDLIANYDNDNYTLD